MWPFTKSPERQLREARAKIELARANKQLSRLQESLPGQWVGQYVELLNRQRRDGWDYLGPYNRLARKDGSNFPLYQTEQELALIRAPSRILCATNDYAIGFCQGLLGYIFGPTGFQFTATSENKELAKALQKVIDETLRRNSWHGGEEPSFEEEVFQRSIEDGEAIVSHYGRDDGWMDFRFVEPEYLTQPRNTQRADWAFGIYRDPDDQAGPDLKYNIRWTDNGEDLEFDADKITILRRGVKRGTKRGCPEFSFNSLEALQLAGDLLLNSGSAAAEQASIVGVREHDTANKAAIQSFVDELADYSVLANAPLGRLEGVDRHARSRWEDMAKNMRYTEGPGVKAAAAGSVHLMVLQALIRAVCTRWNAPEWLGSADASNNNFASSKVVGAIFANRIEREQAKLRSVFLKMIWAAVEHYLSRKGTLPGTNYTLDVVRQLAEIQADAPEPSTETDLEQAQVRQIEAQSGVLSRKTWQKLAGYDPDEESENIDKEQEKQGTSDPLGMFRQSLNGANNVT